MESYGRWQALAVELKELNPKQTFHQGMLAECHEHTADVHREMGNRTAAVWAYRQALDIVKPMAKADPRDTDVRVQLARILSSLGGALIEIGELTAAQSRLADARSVQESILASSPKHARARRGLTATTTRMSRLATENSFLGSDGH